MSEDPHGGAHTQAFGQGAEHFPNATSRGLEPIQDRPVPDAELRVAGLDLEIPNIFLATVAAVANESVDLVIGDALVQAVGVGTGIPSGRDPLLAERATRAFDLRIRLERGRCWRAVRLARDATRWAVVRGARFEWARGLLGVDSMGDRREPTPPDPQQYEADDNQEREHPAFRRCHFYLTRAPVG